jgi:hypothetical protein
MGNAAGGTRSRIQRILEALELIDGASVLADRARGECALDGLYRGNTEPWWGSGERDRRYRALAAHPELPISRAELRRAVQTAALARELAFMETSRVLTPDHIQAVIRLPRQAQEHFLHVAERRGLSAPKLARLTNRVDLVGPGRPRQAPIEKTLARLEELGMGGFDGVHTLVGQTSEQSLRNAADLKRYAQACLHYADVLERHGSGEFLVGPPILVVLADDELCFRVVRELEVSGRWARPACTAWEAATLECSFDGAIVDIDLVDGDGVVLARRLLERGRVPWVLFFTSKVSTEHLAVASHVGQTVAQQSGVAALCDAVCRIAAAAAAE